MTPDEIITEIFRIQEERRPDTDPGDIDISVQDDMPMVAIHQQSPEARPFGQLAFGESIQEALENALANVKRDPT